MRELWELFSTFFRIGAFTFGGGYAMLPIIQREIVDNKKWATDEEVVDYYAIGQCTPGVIAINMATFIGHKQKGFWGVIATSVGIVLPSLIIIILIASSFMHFQDNLIVQRAFAGIRVAVVVLIINTIIKLWKNSVKDVLGIIIFGLAFFVAAFTRISSIIVVIIAIVLGVGFNWRRTENQ